jgi:predicted dehydrogenase/threonine dehydrogenase-like Zn-dependent dehydrogenase
MKQIIQNYRTGELELAEVPVPLCSLNNILVKNLASLISIGSERSVIELGRESLLGKARARPDLAKRFLDKAKKEGFVKTFKEALERLDNPTPLGYSSAGVVIEAGSNVHKFSPGDSVACIGAGYASHAEYITVPENLCAHLPARKAIDSGSLEEDQPQITNNDLSNNSITFEEGSFGMLGIIALHGIRSAKLNFGDSVAVIGLGLLGLLTVQILKAYGCKIIGFDIDSHKVDLAKKNGMNYVFSSEDNFILGVERVTQKYGADAVIITAATKSEKPVNTAVEISRFGGRIVLVGVADIHPKRNEMWHKEVELIVSRAGGPGAFDPLYENKGIDYPIGIERWTENRNLEEFLRLIADGSVDVRSLISNRFKVHDAEQVYQNMMVGKGGPYIGVILEYPEEKEEIKSCSLLDRLITLNTDNRITNNDRQINVGVIGAGLFGKSLLLPAIKKVPDINLDTIATSSSANTYHTAKKYGFAKCTTNYKEVIDNNDISSVIILTPHSLHANMVIEALKSGKHVFVEKPLCINEGELKEIVKIYSKTQNPTSETPILMVGYNRRFSPHAIKVSEYLKARKEPMVVNYRINAGFVPSEHWVHSEEEGGSRVIGEICHFVDLMQFLTKSNPKRVYAERISGNNRTALNSDNLNITLKFEDGSVGNILYSASGDRAYSREQIEIFCEGSVIVLTDFKETRFYVRGSKKRYKTLNQQMGYKEELQHFFDAVSGKTKPQVIPQEIFTSTLTVFKINESLKKVTPIEVVL